MGHEQIQTEGRIHAPPSPRPACTGVWGTTKTQLQAKQKATKEAKAKANKERKFAIATRKTRAVAKKKECLISFVEAKVVKAGSRVAELRKKMEEATKGATVCTLPGCGTAPTVLISPYSHSHKKCKGITGSPSSGHPPAVCSQLSSQ